MRTLWLNLSARCLSLFTGRFNRPTPSDSTRFSRLWCIPTQCATLPFLSGLSLLRSPLLHNPGVYAGVLGFDPMLLQKLDRREIPRSRDRGNSYRSNPGSPSIRGSGSCLRLCRVVFACYTPTGGSRPTPAEAGQVYTIIKLFYYVFKMFVHQGNVDNVYNGSSLDGLLQVKRGTTRSWFSERVFLDLSSF